MQRRWLDFRRLAPALTGESSDGKQVTLFELPSTLEQAAWVMVEQVLSER